MTTLCRTERDRLGELEGVIDAGIRTFLSVGKALLEIRDKRLYRASHPTFEDYCQTRWGMTRQWANKLICEETRPAKVSQNLETEFPKSDTNGHADRIKSLIAEGLAGLPPEEQLEVVEASEAALLNGHADKPASAFRRPAVVDQASCLAAAQRKITDLRELTDRLDCDRNRAHKLLSKLLAVYRGAA